MHPIMKIDEFIQRIEEKPGMYFSDDDISVIETMIYGYQQAIIIHGLENDSTTFNHDFNEYLHCEYKWNTSYGWAKTLIEKYPKGKRFNAFLKYFKEFRGKNA